MIAFLLAMYIAMENGVNVSPGIQAIAWILVILSVLASYFKATT